MALALDHLLDDERFGDALARKANEDALDAELSRVLAEVNLDEAVERIRACNVLVAPVNSAPAVMSDPQLQAREYFVAIERAVVGTHLYPGAVARMRETPLSADAPAPLLGEHNRAVFREMLAMSEEEIGELERSGVIGSSPRQYRAAS
jgi:crotonobetainyl-CoA:carnitine CoA-transferase CaiB-like acyl-CoA transferase